MDLYTLEYNEKKGAFRFKLGESKRENDPDGFMPVCYNINDVVGNDFIDIAEGTTREYKSDHTGVCKMFADFMIKKDLCKDLIFVELIEGKSFFDARNIAQ